MGGIDVKRHGSRILNTKNIISDIRSNNIPKILIKDGWHTVGTWRFEWVHLLECSLDFVGVKLPV